MGNVHMEATQINYRGGSKKMSVEEAIKAAGTEITPEEKEWIDTIPELASQEIIAHEFDAEEGVYSVGDLVIYQGGLYKFTTAHETAGAWNPEEVAAVKVSDELDTLKSGLTNYENQNDLNLEVPDRKNVLPLTLAKIKSLNENMTWVDNVGTIGTNTVTISSDSNGYVSAIKVEGSTQQFIELTNELDSSFNGMILTGCPVGGTGQTYRLLTVQSETVTSIDLGNGVTVSGLTTGGSLQIRIGSNVLPEGGLTFYPMIRLASVTDSTFAPYVPSVNSRLIKHEIITLTGATTNAGVLSSNISSNDRIVMAYTDNYIVMPYVNSGVWKFVICDSASNGIVQIKNTEVTISVIKETVGS